MGDQPTLPVKLEEPVGCRAVVGVLGGDAGAADAHRACGGHRRRVGEQGVAIEALRRGGGGCEEDQSGEDAHGRAESLAAGSPVKGETVDCARSL